MIAFLALLLLPELVIAQETVEPYAYRYEEIETDDGSVVRRVRYTLSEKKTKDEERMGEILADITEYLPQGQQQNYDPRAVAEWQYYWEQLKLWEKYIHQEMLGGVSLDKTVKDMNFADPATIEAQVQDLYDSHSTQAQNVAKRYYNNFISLLGRIEDRIWQRDTYRTWVENNKLKLQEFAYEWLKRATGEEIEIEGKVYLVSPKPLKQVPPGKYNIVTTNLTPYDLLNEDGTLKAAPAAESTREETTEE